MELKLSTLTASQLTYDELAGLPGRVQDDIDKNIDKAKLTDAGLNDYLADLKTKGTAFKNGLGKGGPNDFTSKVLDADHVRDKAYSVFLKALKLAEESDDEQEVEAAKSILNMLKPFGNVPKKNFEAESADIDSILTNLSDAKHKPHITTLGHTKYVTKIQTANDAFKALFATRVSDELLQPVFDRRAPKKELIAVYTDTVEYILSMAKNKKNPNVDTFIQLLNVVNSSREYFQDTYISRGKKKKDKPAPKTTDTPTKPQ